MISLETLPAELIVRISQLANTTAVLRLARVSRRLRQACYDRTVFLAHLNEPVHMTGHMSPDARRDTSLLARYALAEVWSMAWLKVNGLMSDERNDMRPPPPDLALLVIPARLLRHGQVLAYLANVLIIGTPSTGHSMRAIASLLGYDFPTNMMLQVQTQDPVPPTKMQRSWYSVWAFLIALHRVRVDHVNSPAVWMDTPLPTLLRRDLERSQHLLDICRKAHAGPRKAFYIHHFHIGCTLGAGNLYSILRDAWPNLDRIAWQGIRLPDFRNSYNWASSLPIPFARPVNNEQDWPSFVAEQRISRCTPDYFTSGEWVGFYTYIDIVQRQTRDWESPMRDIQFTGGRLTSPGWTNRGEGDEEGMVMEDFYERTGTPMHFHGSGTNLSGRFELTFLCEAEGFMTGLERYADPPWEWQWLMSVTPFGIYGVWTHVVDDFANLGEVKGAILLWKKEWYNAEQNAAGDETEQDESV